MSLSEIVDISDRPEVLGLVLVPGPGASPGAWLAKCSPECNDRRVGAIVCVVNQKGGVGKTTVTLGLASAAQKRGDRVLVVDADPQASATWALGIEPEAVIYGTSQAMAVDEVGAASRAVVPSLWGKSIDVVPAGRTLLDRETEVGKTRMARRLERALRGVADDYELVLIDCCPALGQLTTNALAAAHLALIVVEPSALSARGVAAVSDLIDGVWEEHNEDLDLAGVIVNRVPAVSSEAERQYEMLARMVGRSTVWKPEVPQRVVIAEALSAKRPIHSYGSRSTEVAAIFDLHYKKLRALGRKSLSPS
jgi:chromosome partitioning protein